MDEDAQATLEPKDWATKIWKEHELGTDKEDGEEFIELAEKWKEDTGRALGRFRYGGRDDFMFGSEAARIVIFGTWWEGAMDGLPTGRASISVSYSKAAVPKTAKECQTPPATRSVTTDAETAKIDNSGLVNQSKKTNKSWNRNRNEKKQKNANPSPTFQSKEKNASTIISSGKVSIVVNAAATPRPEAKAKVSRCNSARDNAVNNGMGPRESGQEQTDEDGRTVVTHRGRGWKDYAGF